MCVCVTCDLDFKNYVVSDDTSNILLGLKGGVVDPMWGTTDGVVGRGRDTTLLFLRNNTSVYSTSSSSCGSKGRVATLNRSCFRSTPTYFHHALTLELE